MEKKREQLHKILDLILDINGIEQRRQELTGSKPTTFFEFCGHVNTVDVRVFENGWREGIRPKIKYGNIPADESDKRLQTLNEIISELEAFKNEMNQVTTECTQCGQEGVKQDMLETIEGYTCEECMKEVQHDGE